MRARDQQLHHLKKRGYRRERSLNDMEVWAKPDDPGDFRTIRACPPLSPETMDALIEEFERLRRAAE